MLIFKRSAIIISRPTGNDHSDDDADCSGNQRYVQKVQSVSVLGNVDVQENGADVEAYEDSSFLSDSISRGCCRLQDRDMGAAGWQ